MSQENSTYHENATDIKELIAILWNKKLFIIFITSIFSILAVIYSLSLSNIYTSTTLLAPTNKDDSLQSKLGQFSSLASFSGINIPKESASKSDEAVVRIKSFEFFSKHFLPNVFIIKINLCQP